MQIQRSFVLVLIIEWMYCINEGGTAGDIRSLSWGCDIPAIFYMLGKYFLIKANCCQGTAMQKKQKGEEQWQRN